MMSSARMRGTHRFLGRAGVIAAAACTVALTSASSAQAVTATWSCGASAVTASVAGMSTLSPVNASHAPCSDETVGLPNTTDAIGLAPTINAKSAFAITSAKPPAGRPITQTVGGATGIEGLSLTTGNGTVVIGVGAAQSMAVANCVDDQPVFTGNSQVTGLTINGQTVTLDGPLTDLTDAISNSPLGGLVTVRLNEQTKTPTGLIQRAAHILVLDAADTPLADVIVAESSVNSSSACDPNADNNIPPGGNNGSGGNGSGFDFKVCPQGAVLDTSSGFCVITAAASGGQGVIVIGRPFTGPSGGTVISLVNARKKYKSVCLNGPGPKFATIGTNKADNITGRNTADRILSLGGNDSVDGGRGNDCIDGGTGSDNLNGAIGNDRVYGKSGNDHLNGGPGKDRLSSGSGNDSINAAYGADSISAGSGRDYINVATAGPPARVDCGSGPDKVRLNRNENRRTKGCEVRYVLDDKSGSPGTPRPR